MTSSTARWIVEYSDHDCGSNGGNMLRKTKTAAERSGRLMKECGYRKIKVWQFTR